MSKLIKVMLVVFSTFALASTASAVQFSVGAAGNAVLGYGTGSESKTSGAVTTTESESGLLDVSHGAVFAEVGTEVFAVGFEYNFEDIDTPEAKNIQEDGGTATTNTVKATIEDMMTYYVTLNIPNTGLYGKLGIVQADVATNEVLGTGGKYDDEELEGTQVGLGYKNSLDNGFFYGFEVAVTEYDDVTSTNKNDATVKVKIENLNTVGASFRVGKTF